MMQNKSDDRNHTTGLNIDRTTRAICWRARYVRIVKYTKFNYKTPLPWPLRYDDLFCDDSSAPADAIQ